MNGISGTSSILALVRNGEQSRPGALATDAQAGRSTTAPATLPELEDVAEQDFDFAAARDAAAATLRRDQYQLMLSGLADTAPAVSSHQAGGTMRQHDVEAAYREFDL